MKIIIFGFTGAGKTTCLENLKSDQKLKTYDFIDLDSHILTQYEEYSSIKDLILSKGWTFFRDIELSLIKTLLNRPKVVLALGGGSVNRELIKYLKGVENLKSIFLDVDFVTCWNRIKEDDGRPITLDGIEQCEVLYSERMVLFRELESICISY